MAGGTPASSSSHALQVKAHCLLTLCAVHRPNFSFDAQNVGLG